MVNVLSFSKSGQDLVTDFSAYRAFVAWIKPSLFRDQLLTGVVCLWIQVTWKCDSEVVSIQLSHRTQSSARSTEYCATARAYESLYRLLLKTIITFSFCRRAYVYLYVFYVHVYI